MEATLTALVCAIVALASIAAADADITGKWTAAFETQIGRQEYTYEFVVKNRRLTGRASSANGTCEIENGRVSGTTVTFRERFAYQGLTIPITYTGVVMSDDEIRFMRQVGQFATEEVIATRVR